MYLFQLLQLEHEALQRIQQLVVEACCCLASCLATEYCLKQVSA